MDRNSSTIASVVAALVTWAVGVVGALMVAGIMTATALEAQQEWMIHDRSRPNPPVVNPGAPGTQTENGRAPSDAIVLFDGKDLSEWESHRGGEAKWKVENGYFEVVPRTGGIKTRRGFGDCQLHVEWMAPDPARGEDQGRGNSGYF